MREDEHYNRSNNVQQSMPGSLENLKTSWHHQHVDAIVVQTDTNKQTWNKVICMPHVWQPLQPQKPAECTWDILLQSFHDVGCLGWLQPSDATWCPAVGAPTRCTLGRLDCLTKAVFTSSPSLATNGCSSTGHWGYPKSCRWNISIFPSKEIATLLWSIISKIQSNHCW